MIKKEEKRRKKKSLIMALVLHVIVAILFLFPALTQPEPLPAEIGVEISLASLGNSYTGSGDQTPAPKPTPTEKPTPIEEKFTPPPTSQPTTPQPKVVEDVHANDPLPAPSKEDKKAEEKPNPVEKPAPKPAPKPTVNKKALYTKTTDAKKSDQAGGSKGTKTGSGNMGSENGKPEGKGVLGGGMGSWELSGRSLVKGAKIEDTKEEGTVVLNIWVDRYGNVLRTSPNLLESTTTSQYLFDLAKKAAMQTRYSPKGNAAVEQKGKMTFVFILR